MLYVIRHGETDWNRLGRIQGRSDIPLNDKGQEDAKGLSRLLERVRFDHIVSSDLARARETAAVLADGRVPHTEDVRLQERAFGPFEGMTVPEIHQVLRTRHAMTATSFDPVEAWPEASGVETLPQVLERAWRVIEAWRTPSQDGHVALVTHGNVVHVLLNHLLQLPPGTPRAIRMPNCCCLELEWRADRLMLRSLVWPGMLGA